jgi:hypothetical protein
MTALRIDWIDSQSWGEKWYKRNEVNEKDFAVPIAITRGEVIMETPTMIYLAQTADKELCHNIIEIPKGCILKKRKIP